MSNKMAATRKILLNIEISFLCRWSKIIYFHSFTTFRTVVHFVKDARTLELKLQIRARCTKAYEQWAAVSPSPVHESNMCKNLLLEKAQKNSLL